MMTSRLFTRWILSISFTALLSTVSFAQGQGVNRVNVLIGFRGGPNADDVALLRAVGAQVKHTYRIIPAVAASVPEPALAGLARDPRVTVIEEDGLVFAIDHTTTTGDAELNNTWGVKHIGGGAANGGAGVKIAVIDSGVDYNHPDLLNRFDSNLKGYDFVNNDDDPKDDNSHGTHVAGTIAASKNDQGVVGVAPEARIYALKVLGANGSGSFSDVIAALQWCVDKGIQVSNNSYGSNGDPGVNLKAAFDNSAAKGVLHIAAAGNSGTPMGKGDNVGYPARYSSVVAVAATDSNNRRASFSSTGPDVEIAAPGVGINSTIPGGGYAVYNGTSMASPHVAGVAALFIQGGITGAGAVRQALRNSAIDLGAVGQDSLFGHGLVHVVADPDSGGSTGGGGGDTGGGSIAPPETRNVIVSSITYDTSGGRNGTKDLLVSIAVVDAADKSTAIGGASVSMQLTNLSLGNSWNGSASTGSNGVVTFKLGNAPSGEYRTTVTSVSGSGLSWDGKTPANGTTK